MLDNDKDRSKSFSRRAFVVGAAQGALLTVLGGRLAWLQIVQGRKYETLSDKNRINTKMVAPSRGEIVDRFGVPLAVNNQNFRVLIIPEQAEDLEQSLKNLARLVDLSDNRVQKILKESQKSSSFVPLEVTDSLDWDEVAKIEVNMTDLPGMSIDEGEIRNYPFEEATGHLIGYVGAVNKAELEDGDNVLSLPGFRIGKTGIEKAFDKPLRGAAGNSQMEVNVIGREVRELGADKSKDGERVALSIDAELQRYVQQRLSEEKSASAVIMDSQTGAIYAMASHPSFDPNLFIRGIDTERWQDLLSNPAFPLNNKAISGQYPPGSTFKMVTAMAALEGGFSSKNTSVKCTGYYEYGADRYYCWKRGGHGTVNLLTSLMKSCDTYYYKLCTEVGIDNIAKMARRLGLGQRYNFDLREERPGLIPDKEWKLARESKPWRPGETIIASIGQGYMLTTPLQLAVMTSRLVNGGRAVEPWLVGYLGHKNLHPEGNWPSIGLNQNHLKSIKRGMDLVVDHKDGTAHSSQIEEPDMKMGGKTGTAQVKRLSRADRLKGLKNEDVQWKLRDHALFVGYAPMDNPRYVCSVVVEHGGGGSSVAAPIAKDILTMAQKRNPASTKIKVS